MTQIISITLTLVVSTLAFADDWKKLPPLPDKQGFAGSFAGISNGALIFAGGANFPDKKPWEGGKKIWYDSVFVLDKPNGEWKVAGKLPRPLGYGVNVTHGNAVICCGGSDADRHYGDVVRIEWKVGKLVFSKLPSLPKSIANACGALVGDTLYVAGGLESPDASKTLNTVYRIDLAAKEPKWQAIDGWPGAGRMLAVGASFDGSFWLIGGTDLVEGKDKKVERRYLKDAWRYDPKNGWKRIADLPRAVVAAPSPAPADATGFYVLGGDDGSQVSVAQEQHRGFSKKILRYDSTTNKWADAGELPFAHVTASCVNWNRLWVIPSGEVRPGVRSPDVWGRSER